MAKEQVDYIIENSKFKLTSNDYANYAAIIFPIFFIVVPIAAFIWDFAEVSSTLYLLVTIPVMFIVGCLFLYFTVTRLRDNIFFKVVATGFSKEHNYDLIRQVFTQEGISFEQYDDCIVGKTKLTLFSWGEVVTAVVQDYQILINSHPASGMQVGTLVKDRSNIKEIERQLNIASSGQ